jgi:Mrp family chromosome partitioning ATPase
VVNCFAVPNAETARLITSLVDCTLLVVEDNVTRESHFRKTLNGLDRTRLLGTVLNRAR